MLPLVSFAPMLPSFAFAFAFAACREGVTLLCSRSQNVTLSLAMRCYPELITCAFTEYLADNLLETGGIPKLIPAHERIGHVHNKLA
jgi:hypothetical protein